MNQHMADEILRDTRVNAFHLMVMFWCSVLMLCDGYDLVIYGAVLPYLMTDWGLSPVTAGLIGSSALLGMMVGALSLGSASDRYGRKPVILVCLVVFSLAAFANGFAENATQFALCRFLTGVGLGGMVPNIVALMAEMAPPAARNRMVTLVLSCYAIGGVVAALIGKSLTPEYGWRISFFIAGLSLLSLPLLYRWLPESLAFLLARGRIDEAEPLLRRYAPQFRGGAGVLAASAEGSRGDAVAANAAELFRRGRAATTLWLWTAFGMCMLMVYGLNTWLPKFMAASGYPLGSAISFLVTLNVGAVLGCLCSGWLADRYGGRPTLMLFFSIAAISIGLLGFNPSPGVLTLLLMCAGATTIGTLCMVYAYAAHLYPSRIRSTGVGWAASAGRIGAVAGPALGGWLLSQHFEAASNFLVFAIPGVLAVFAVTRLPGSERDVGAVRSVAKSAE
ncbi:MFS transporter [Cupriavidus pauculus]|uniref:Aromatic acid/H+ symport family MFS transporter n=1 Tax=Cupriavidus pauculus TaxID=82633 RepID=A0A2N5C6S8_9BURK|nr:aromatic acid/H+ symport family MFS transporter [Cupriavidus pauculus]PLP97913.1 aromatic acid/H+ symport family MFS transporter [Cupriavidus pauculus]